MEEIKVKYYSDAIDELRYVDGKSDWIDLHASETVTLRAGEFRLIPLGVAIALPEGYGDVAYSVTSKFERLWFYYNQGWYASRQ